jgi:hypothetical protein
MTMKTHHHRTTHYSAQQVDPRIDDAQHCLSKHMTSHAHDRVEMHMGHFLGHSMLTFAQIGVCWWCVRNLANSERNRIDWGGPVVVMGFSQGTRRTTAADAPLSRR